MHTTSLILLYISFSVSVRAQPPSTTAVCTSNDPWMTNDLGQSPCLVAAYLRGACVTGFNEVPELHGTYPRPGDSSDPSTLTICSCSHAVYNLMSACAACQKQWWWRWDQWNDECDGYETGTSFPYNISIPSGTSIPFWATTDPTTWPNGSFDLDAARNIDAQGNPDVTMIPTPSPTAAPSSKSEVPAGAIAGAVVGGVVVIAAIIGCLLYYRIRRERRKAEQQQLMAQPFPQTQAPLLPSQSSSRLPMSLGNSSTSGMYNTAYSGSTDQHLMPKPVPFRIHDEVHPISPYDLSKPVPASVPEKRARYNPPAYSTPSPEQQSAYGDPPPLWTSSSSNADSAGLTLTGGTPSYGGGDRHGTSGSEVVSEKWSSDQKS